MSERVRTVAVVGRDASLWLSAAAIQRALGRTGVRVHAIELPTRLSAVDAYAALPTLAALHGLLGLDERLVLDSCGGLPMVAQRFSDWAKDAPPFFLAYDDEPPPGAGLPFVQYWAKGVNEGLQVALQEFSLGSACARLNRVPVAGDHDAPFSASYGYHLDATAYVALLKELARRIGVEIAGQWLGSVDITGDWIEGLELGDGSRVKADLYIDASGREARLASALESSAFEPWSEWLPCDRMLVASAPRLPTLPVFSQVSAFHAGWVALYPLRDRTAVSVAYSGANMADSDLIGIASAVTGLPIGGEAVVSELRPGCSRQAWIGNCVAVGEAAVTADPIDALELHLTHGCISHLVNLFPATAGEFPEAEAYNAAIRSFGANLRDFQAAHYLFNGRVGEALWDKARQATPPPGLGRKAAMFSARAKIPLNDEETFQEQGWAALLAGCGMVPEGYDPRVDATPAQSLVEGVQQRLRDVARLARAMPTIEQFLAVDRPPMAQGRG